MFCEVAYSCGTFAFVSKISFHVSDNACDVFMEFFVNVFSFVVEDLEVFIAVGAEDYFFACEHAFVCDEYCVFGKEVYALNGAVFVDGDSFFVGALQVFKELFAEECAI